MREIGLPADHLAVHPVERGRERRRRRKRWRPVDLVAARRELARELRARRRRLLLEQLARDDEMFGKAPRLVVAHRELARAFVEHRRHAEFEDHREQQDREDLADQAGRAVEVPAQRRAQSRVTGALNI